MKGKKIRLQAHRRNPLVDVRRHTTGMRHLIVLTLLFIALPAIARSQTHGYAFFAPGGASGGGQTESMYHFGVGGDIVFWKGLGFSPELGYVNGTQQSFENGFGLGSLDATYHFGRRARLNPFIAGGYSIAFRSGHASMGNFGGGVNWWFRNRMGLKVEFRDHIDAERGDFHLWGVRFGLTFR